MITESTVACSVATLESNVSTAASGSTGSAKVYEYSTVLGGWR
jgi:hypothetical protein